MKRLVLFLFLNIFMVHVSHSQEWMTSLEAAKRIALIQDKFLFMIWEDAAQIPYPVTMNSVSGQTVIYDNLFNHDEINKIIWAYFVPVIVNENKYAEVYDQTKRGKSKDYIAQFDDDNVKIMDVNCTILNTSTSPEAYFNLSDFITKYALNTSFLTGELKNYFEHQSFNTAFRLASKYMDYAILVGPQVRNDVLNMSDMYLDEAEIFLAEEASNNNSNYQQKIQLLRLAEYLITDRPGKVLRNLKRMEASEIRSTDQSQYAFLYYTAYLLRKDEKEADLWKDKVSDIDLKKARLIAKLHL